MQRREFSRWGASALTASALGLPLAGPALAQTAFKEGKDYLKLSTPAMTKAPAGKIEVVEFFGYFCPHCNAFEPAMNAWIASAPKDVVVHRVPVNFGPQTAAMQKLYYALEAMDRLKDLHAQVFRTVHVDRQQLVKDEQVAAWAAKQGLDAARFKEAYNSFSVANQVRQATALQEAYKIDGVPSIGIAGRYYVDGTLAGNMQAVLRITDMLIERVRKG